MTGGHRTLSGEPLAAPRHGPRARGQLCPSPNPALSITSRENNDGHVTRVASTKLGDSMCAKNSRKSKKGGSEKNYWIILCTKRQLWTRMPRQGRARGPGTQPDYFRLTYGFTGDTLLRYCWSWPDFSWCQCLRQPFNSKLYYSFIWQIRFPLKYNV